jgi:exosome complex RNA-binding protein Rrp42 (RNase PH superfamily)
MVLEADAHIIDACSVAIFAALKTVKIPKTELIIGESGRFEDFDISGDLADARPMPINDIPICITAAKVSH